MPHCFANVTKITKIFSKLHLRFRNFSETAPTKSVACPMSVPSVWKTFESKPTISKACFWNVIYKLIQSIWKLECKTNFVLKLCILILFWICFAYCIDMNKGWVDLKTAPSLALRALLAIDTPLQMELSEI